MSSVAASSPILAAHIQQKPAALASVTTSPMVGSLPQKSSPLPSIATVLNFGGGTQPRPPTALPVSLSTPSTIISTAASVAGIRKTADGLPAISPNPFSMHMMNHNIPRVISGEPDKECGIIPCSKDAVITQILGVYLMSASSSGSMIVVHTVTVSARRFVSRIFPLNYN